MKGALSETIDATVRISIMGGVPFIFVLEFYEKGGRHTEL